VKKRGTVWVSCTSTALACPAFGPELDGVWTVIPPVAEDQPLEVACWLAAAEMTSEVEPPMCSSAAA